MDTAKTIFNNESKQPIMVLDNTISLEEAYCGQEKLNYLINKKYQDKLNTTKLKPFKWGWEDNGED